MVKFSEIIDYLICTQLVVSILLFKFAHNKYEGIIVYFGIIIFISYWLLKTIFNKKYKEMLS
jgi:hypothetical protein